MEYPPDLASGLIGKGNSLLKRGFDPTIKEKYQRRNYSCKMLSQIEFNNIEQNLN